MSFAYLAIAVVFEVIATSSLKASEEFTRLWPSVIVVIGYGLAFYLLSLCFCSHGTHNVSSGSTSSYVGLTPNTTLVAQGLAQVMEILSTKH